MRTLIQLVLTKSFLTIAMRMLCGGDCSST